MRARTAEGPACRTGSQAQDGGAQGDDGTGTATYAGDRRDHLIEAAGRPPLAASSDPAFRGEPSAWNPELLLLASVSSCHMLWFLHLAGAAGLIVTAYRDAPSGVMAEEPCGAGQFVEIVLRPVITFAVPPLQDVVARLHEDAHAHCFVARSVNFPVHCRPP